MTIKVACPQCGSSLKAPKNMAGKKAQCPRCKSPVSIPLAQSADEMGFELLNDPAPSDETKSGRDVGPSDAAASGRAHSAEQLPAPAASRGSRQAAQANAPADSPAASMDDLENELRNLAPTVAPKFVAPSAPAASRGVQTIGLGIAVPRTAALAGNLQVQQVLEDVRAQTTFVRMRRGGILGLCVLALTVFPLTISMFEPEEEGNELGEYIRKHPEIINEVERELANQEVTEKQVLSAIISRLPGGKLPRAHLTRFSWMHWLYALVAVAAFLSLIMLFFDAGGAKTWHVLCVGAFTATFGILFLLVVQWISMHVGFPRRGNIVVLIIWAIIWFIGFSYRAATAADAGFAASFFGFTFGVGLCEELTKVLPLLIFFKSGRNLDWRAAIAWGLASGVGFGVSEGIMYSSDFYNGIMGFDIYVVRFVSCVALHAVWCASTALLIWRDSEFFCGEWDWGEFAFRLLIVMGAPMVLHGLYDTFLKMELNFAALATAAVSYAYLAALIVWIRRIEASEERMEIVARLRRAMAS